MKNTSIEWADITWNPVTGCDRVSEGCDTCYALSMAKRLKGMGSPKYQTDGDPRTSGPGFGVAIHPDTLLAPVVEWPQRSRRRVFVNSMSDMFHDGIPDDYLVRMLAVMALAPQHTFLALTKRHARMRSFLRDECRCGSGHQPGVHLRSAMAWAVSKANPDRLPGLPDDAEHRVYHQTPWPLPNLWVGVSVENQKWADIRIPALLETPAAVRFLSCEPLLGSVTLTDDWLAGLPSRRTWVDWVIVGGESGPGARPMHPDWARSLRDQCDDFGVPFFFKQWGEWVPESALLHGSSAPAAFLSTDGITRQLVGGKPPAPPMSRGADITVRRVGKKKAGNVLDGSVWEQYPTPVSGSDQEEQEEEVAAR